ncbi:MAG: radical SAM protein [bacterium]|nr:radical SAM protein [bacterium]
MKVALINPGKSEISTAMSMGLGYLAAVAREKGHEVVVKDMEVEPEGLKEFLLKEKPEIVGITLSTPLFPLSKKIISQIRAVLPDVKILVGGPHVTAVKEEMLSATEADIAVYGEGEMTFVEILEGEPLEKILGICYRKDGKLETNPPRPFIQDLDSLPFPAWDLFPLSEYRIHPPYGKSKKFMNMITSRGCPYKCAYCSKVWGHSFRGMSPERVLEEIKLLRKNYGISEFRFYDDDFTLNMKRAEEICDLIIRNNLRITWSCTTRVNLVNENLLAKMKQSGCFLICYGVESGNQEILNTISKGYKIEHIKTAFKLTRAAGIRTLAFLMLGLPGETEETIEETVELVKEIKPDFCSWGITSVYPNTELKEIFKKRNAKFTPYTNWGTFTIDAAPNKYIEFAEENLSMDFLEKKVRELNRAFYLSPGKVFKELINARSFWEIKRIMNAGLKLTFKGK